MEGRYSDGMTIVIAMRYIMEGNQTLEIKNGSTAILDFR
jgi:hypothetical protein